MFHQGHLNILRAARERCDRLVVGVTSDEALIRMKGRAPVIPLKERCDLVSSLRFVDAVVVDLDQDKRLAWRLQPFDVLFKGDDWKDTPKGAQLEAEMAEVGARVVAAACAAFGWTPNFVSFISVCFSTLGLIVLVAFEPAWWTGLIVGTALAVGFMFDSADGQVSRVTGASSKTGEWVDHVADAFRSPAIHFCTAAAVMVYRPESWWLAIVALVYGWVTSGQFMSQILAEQFVRAAGRKQTRGGNLRSFVLLPTDPGVLCWSFVLWGFGVPFMVLYTFLAVIAVAHSSISLRRRFRDLRALDAAAKEAAKQGESRA